MPTFLVEYMIFTIKQVLSTWHNKVQAFEVETTTNALVKVPNIHTLILYYCPKDKVSIRIGDKVIVPTYLFHPDLSLYSKVVTSNYKVKTTPES